MVSIYHLMLKLYAIIIAAVAAIVGGGIFFAARLPASESIPSGSGGAVSLPWIEVTAPRVFEIDLKSREVLRELKTGDEVAPGKEVRTDVAGLANIYFPDGSMIRLDSDTEVVIAEAAFDPESATLVVRITLEAGRVWSKIFELATPDSLWEVKTSNAVATVRGTAFDVLHQKGVTQILGSENTVSVYVRDNTTGEPILGTEGRLAADTVIVISEKERDLLIAKPSPLVSRPAPETMREEAWVRENKVKDLKFNQEIEELRREEPDDAGLREKLYEILYQKFERARDDGGNEGPSPEEAPSSLLEREPIEKTTSDRPEIKESERKIEKNATDTPSLKPVDTKAEKEVLPVRLESSIAGAIPAPKALSLRAVRKFDRAIEGDEITFQAILTMTDGSTRDVTEHAKWQVIGPIGQIARPGVFTAKLEVSVAEFGIASGSIAAVWKDSASGKEFLGATPIFEVEARIEKALEERG